MKKIAKEISRNDHQIHLTYKKITKYTYYINKITKCIKSSTKLQNEFKTPKNYQIHLIT